MNREAPDPTEVTGLLKAWTGGDHEALDRLIPVVHRELRRIAHRHMRNERAGNTLQTTALVNEVYLRLVDVRNVDWQHRAQFFALSSKVMRRILVDAARSRGAQRRGGGMEAVNIEDVALVAAEPGDSVIALDAALDEFARLAPRPAEVIELHYFGGLSHEEVASVLKTSTRTVERDFQFAKSWLLRELNRQ
jgi:RNA polymerase sigma factor (TIGR02999 family)